MAKSRAKNSWVKSSAATASFRGRSPGSRFKTKSIIAFFPANFAGGVLADKRHRIVSESGRIEVRIAPGARGRLPFCAMTNCGVVRVPEAEEEILHSSSYALKDNSGIVRMWGGVLLAHGGPPPSLKRAFNQRDVIEHVVLGDDHSPALFLFSRSGTVKILYQR